MSETPKRRGRPPGPKKPAAPAAPEAPKRRGRPPGSGKVARPAVEGARKKAEGRELKQAASKPETSPEGGNILADALSADELAFVNSYMRTRSAASAYREIRPEATPATVRSEASVWANKPNIQKALREARRTALEAAGVEQASVLEAVARLGYVDIREAFAEDGTPLPIRDMPPQVAACLVGVEIHEYTTGKGDNVKHVKVHRLRFSDKLAALRSLGDHTGAWKPESEADDQGPMPAHLEALMKAATDALEAGMGTAMNRLDKIEAMAAAARSRAMRAAEEDFAKVEDARIVSETPIS